MGGGTPSLIPGEFIQHLLSEIRDSGWLHDTAEITLEANPGAIDEANFHDYLAAGVNRLSIGVQSFSDHHLKKIGRIHQGKDALTALKRAKHAGFKRINVDLMIGLPDQTLADAINDISKAIETKVEHISMYQLTLEPNTEFALNPPTLPNTDLQWDMQVQAQNLLTQSGYLQYEVSAYSRNAPCEHNTNYWQFGDYIAIGAGAHGKLSEIDSNGHLTIRRYWNHRHPKAYLQAQPTSDYCAKTTIIPTSDINFEFLMNALRLRNGFSFDLYKQRTSGDVENLLHLLQPLQDKNFLAISPTHVSTTDLGQRFLDDVLMHCLPLKVKVS